MEWVTWVINPNHFFLKIEMFKLNPFAEMQRDFFWEILRTIYDGQPTTDIQGQRVNVLEKANNQQLIFNN